MAERVDLVIDDAAYDRVPEEIRRNGTAEAGDLKFVLKAGGTVEGRCTVLITFTAMVDGRAAPVQATTTGRG